MKNGVNKQIIEVKKTDNPYFERVIFIVNPEKSYINNREKRFQAARFLNRFCTGGVKENRIKRIIFSAIKISSAAAAGAAAACLIKM